MPLPSVTSGLQWWFDARDITGISDGAPIVFWADSTGNGHLATVQTGSAIYHASQFLSGAALTLSSCRFGISGSLTQTGAHTVFAVFRLSGVGGNQTIVGQNSSGGLNHRLVQNNGGSVRLQFAWADTGTGMEGTGTAAPDTAWHQAILQQNGNSSLGFLLDVATDPLISGGSGLSAGMHSPITIGGTGVGEFFGGQLQIVGYWNRVLSSIEVADVWLTATPLPPPVSGARGNIDWDQVGLDARHGPTYGVLIQYADGTHTAGNFPKFLSDGTTTDSGVSATSGATPILNSAGEPIFDVNGIWIFPG